MKIDLDKLSFLSFEAGDNPASAATLAAMIPEVIRYIEELRVVEKQNETLRKMLQGYFPYVDLGTLYTDPRQVISISLDTLVANDDGEPIPYPDGVKVQLGFDKDVFHEINIPYAEAVARLREALTTVRPLEVQDEN
jgi:hypothetical protein